MKLVNRRVTYRMYPSPTEESRLEAARLLHQRLYNACLEQRQMAYRNSGKGLYFEQQCKELTLLRASDSLYKSLDAQSAQCTLRRLDLAFANFFDRCAEGLPGGYPRFKSQDRFKGFSFSQTGWKFIPGIKLSKRGTAKHGQLKLSGIGIIQVRGVPRNIGTYKTCTITKRAGQWYASLVMDCAPVRACGTKVGAGDLGLETFLTMVFGEDGELPLEVPNPRIVKKALKKQEYLDKELHRKVMGSEGRKRAKEERQRFFAKQKNQRANFLHQISAALISLLALFATEELNVAGMTSAGGPRKAGLNRELLSAAFATFLGLLQTKAEEAGVVWIWVPTKTVKPSQTCHLCGRQEKKLLSQREHVCLCGANCGRDVNAARVMLQWALKSLEEPVQLAEGLESSPAGFQGGGAGIRETTTIVAST